MPDPAQAFPSPADIIQCHADALGIAPRTARFHVLHRDRLEAAVTRPRQHAHYRGADDVEQAAVLAESLVSGHCFVDGNKRTAWVAMVTFLEVRGAGQLTRYTPAEAAERMIRLTMRDETADDLARWLRERVR